MPIKMKSGKDYYTVVERMDMMIEEKGREDYSLETEVTYESGVVIVKATLTLFNCYPKDETDTVEVVSRKYVGHALGELGKAKTLEATETHAIGRALSSAGWYGSEFASANEMETYQTKPKPETTKTKTTKSKESDLIEEVIENYEPRVNLLRVSVNANIDSYNMDVIINYEIVGIDIPPQELSFVLIPTR